MGGKDDSSATTTKIAHQTADITRRMVCGGLAGMIAKTATNPLDRIRMLAQTGAKVEMTAVGSSTGGNARIIALYRSILEKEGIIGLWAGNGANLLRVFPAKAVVFSSNDVYQQLLKRIFQTSQEQTLSAPLAFLAGGMSGMSATAVTYPLDLARGRIAGTLANSKANKKEYSGILRTLLLTIRDEGFVALYKGSLPTLLGAMPYEGIKFGTVGILETLYPLDEGDRPTPVRKMLFGGMGGAMAGIITYPNDTVRRLLQLEGSRGREAKYKGYWDCAKQVYRQEGITRFYRGCGLNLVRMVPNTAVQFGSYELLKQWTSPYF